MRSNHASEVGGVGVGGVTKGGDLVDSLTSLLQELVLLRIIIASNSYLIGSLIVQTSHPSEPLGSNLLVVEAVIPSLILNPSMTS